MLLDMTHFPGGHQGQIPFCSLGREYFDYDVVDENMIGWGHMAHYRVLVHTSGVVYREATLRAIDAWLRADGDRDDDIWIIPDAELGNLRLILTNGEALNRRSDLYAIVIGADEHTTIFIDEAQGLNGKTQNLLLTAISERILPVSGGSAARGYAVPLKNFALVLATTHEYLLQDALRDRMRIYCRFNYYAVEDLVEIVRQRAEALNWPYESDEVLRTIAQRSKGTPRQALN